MFVKRIKQHDIMDCGAVCLATIFWYYNLKVPLYRIRELMKVDKTGASVYGIMEVAEKYNLKAECLKGSIEDLISGITKNIIEIPFIAHIVTEEKLAHFIVIEKIAKGNIKIFDPAKGVTFYSYEQFEKLWTGYRVPMLEDSLIIQS